MKKTLNIIMGVAIFLSLAGAAWADHEHPIDCGDTVTDDTTLTAADPVVQTSKNAPCLGDGLHVSAGVTLDGANETIWGNLTGIGIKLLGNDVTVKNLRVRRFETGLDSGVVARTGTKISNVQAMDSVGKGIRLEGNNNLLERSRARKGGQRGITVNGDGNTIVRNTGQQNHGRGIFVIGGGNFLLRNRGIGNTKSGIEVEGDDNFVCKNMGTRNELTGVLVKGQTNTLGGNRAIRNDGKGVAANPSPATAVDEGGNMGKDNGGANCEINDALCSSSKIDKAGDCVTKEKAL